MPIRVLSFDVDGCMYNRHYIDSEIRNVLQSNEKLLNKIKTDNLSYKKSIMFIGSNRQSYHTDRAGNQKHKTESCFLSMQKVAAHLDIELDTFLMTDLYADSKHGDSFTKAVHPQAKNIQHEHWIFDDSKATLLYAQIHKVATENPSEEILFEFYDDRVDIINMLLQLYLTHSELIPSNVILKVHHYYGDLDTLQFREIRGKGIIDSNYQQTVKDMVKCTDAATKDPAHIALDLLSDNKVQELENRIQLADNTAFQTTSIITPLVTLRVSETGQGFFTNNDESAVSHSEDSACKFA